ncbi:Nucleolar complex protein 3 [Mactra antiquata]
MATKKKAQGKRKKSVSKTSASKLFNKRQNKLGKQGKLKQESLKKKTKEKKALKRENQQVINKDIDNQDVEEHEELGKDAIKFFGKRRIGSSFVAAAQRSELGNVAETKKRKRNKNDTEVESDEEEYERLPRKQSKTKEKKMILPIKTKHGIVPQMIDDDSGKEENGEDITVDKDVKQKKKKVKPEPLPVLTGVQLFVNRQEKLRERKEKIALLSNCIVENPEESIKKLKELVKMLNESDPDVFVTVRKLVMISLLEIFKDIIPGYYIRPPTEQEQGQKMKKDTKAVMSFETGLLNCYKDYLEYLEKTAKGSKYDENNNKKKKKKRQPDIVLPEKTQMVFTCLSVKCLCDLLSQHTHFNYTNNIITVIVPYMNYRDEKVSEIACECVKKCFKEDKSGKVTLEITKCIGNLIKTKDYRIKPKVLETFLSLKIKEVSYTDPLTKDDDKKKENYKLNDKLSRREKKIKKKNMFLERDLHETKATEDKKLRLELHTETIQAIFLTYFRILKKANSSILFPAVLEGLAKFAHLISVDFFQDLFAVFNKLIAEEELSYRESLHCVQTAFTILSGQGSVLNIDPVVFYKHLYKNLYHIHAGCTSNDIPIILDCLDIMISKRKRQVSQQRVLAFIKRLATLSTIQTSAGTLGMLSAIRTLMLTYSYTDILLDNDTQGSGVFLPEIDDPEHSNSHNTALWELTTLKHHYNPSVRKLSSHICTGKLTSGDNPLHPDLRKQPVDMFTSAQDVDVFEDQSIPEKIKNVKSIYRRKMGDLLQTDLKDIIVSTLESVKEDVVLV